MSIDNVNNELSTNLSEVIKLQQSEANLSCSRNNYFIVVTSLLILAISQFNNNVLKLICCCLGFAISISWLLTHDRSSKYTKYWKSIEKKLSQQMNRDSVYPDSIGGFEMRKILFILPISFVIFWIVLILYTLFSSTIEISISIK